ncbi:MAG TPA: hypothetical protein PK416_05735 [Thermodesulfobacteriota bacterium]|nr:hypothetical protein [Thermodesulfobacteriota bacterium]
MAQVRVGFLVDTSRCIGCRSCQVACKAWNHMDADKTVEKGSYENPTDLTPITAAAPGYARPGVAGEGERPPLMPLVIDAVRARASVGEISDALRAAWGEYRPS